MNKPKKQEKSKYITTATPMPTREELDQMLKNGALKPGIVKVGKRVGL